MAARASPAYSPHPPPIWLILRCLSRTFHMDIAEMCAKEGKLNLSVGIDRKFDLLRFFTETDRLPGPMIAAIPRR